MTHTPGPWFNDGTDIMAEDNFCVATIHRPRMDDEGTYMSNGQANANARLIAAAPELLSALKQAAAFIQSHNECLSVPSGSGDTQWNDYCIGVAEHLTAVISKAEGGE